MHSGDWPRVYFCVQTLWWLWLDFSGARGGLRMATWSCWLMVSGPLCWIFCGAGWLLKNPLRGKVSGTGGLGIYWFEGTHVKDCSWPGCAAGSEVSAVVVGLFLGRSLFREISRDQELVPLLWTLRAGLQLCILLCTGRVTLGPSFNPPRPVLLVGTCIIKLTPHPTPVSFWGLRPTTSSLHSAQQRVWA